MASISAPDVKFGETLVVTVADTRNKFVRVVVERGGIIVYETFPKVRGGTAQAYIGPTPTWDGSGLPLVGMAETGKLTGGRWTAEAADTFEVS